MEYEPILARSISDALLAAWLEGGQQAVSGLSFEPPEVPPTIEDDIPTPDDDGPVSFPQIQRAAKNLAQKRLLTRQEFDALDNRAKVEAFTVAGLATETTLEKVRQALVEDIQTGGTLREFQNRVERELGVGVLSPGHLENIFRTGVGQQYKRGQKEMADHPLVADEFPYVMYVSVRDSRRRDTHKWFETGGLNGTNIYRRDDPVIQKFWAPWEWQCRCSMVLLSLEDAARRGVREAQEWLRTGVPPANPQYVAHPPFDVPAGFAS